MTPHEYVAWLQRMRTQVDQVPVVLEQQATKAAMTRVPPGTSVAVSRTGSGVRVAFSGPFAGPMRANVRARMRQITPQVAAEAVRRST